MKRTLIISLILLLFAFTAQQYLLRRNKGNSKLKYIDADRFKNKNGFYNARRSRIVNYKGGRNVIRNNVRKGPYRRRYSRIGKCPEGQTIKCYPLRGCKCIKNFISKRNRNLNRTKTTKTK